MMYRITFLIGFLTSTSLSAQQLISFLGGTTKENRTEISWSAGEIAIQTIESQPNAITQGVQQPNPQSTVEKEQEVGIYNGIDMVDDMAFKVVLSDKSSVFYDLYVLNRWGELLDKRVNEKSFQGEIEWNLDDFQQRKGQALPNGTYYFILELKTGRGNQAKTTRIIKQPFYILSKRQ